MTEALKKFDALLRSRICEPCGTAHLFSNCNSPRSMAEMLFGRPDAKPKSPPKPRPKPRPRPAY